VDEALDRGRSGDAARPLWRAVNTAGVDREEPAEFGEDAQAAEVAPESPAVAPELPSVEIVPLSELDPSSTALEPELASELARRADDVILDAATCASVIDPANAASTPLDDAPQSSNPSAAGRGPDPLAGTPQ